MGASSGWPVCLTSLAGRKAREAGFSASRAGRGGKPPHEHGGREDRPREDARREGLGPPRGWCWWLAVDVGFMVVFGAGVAVAVSSSPFLCHSRYVVSGYTRICPNERMSFEGGGGGCGSVAARSGLCVFSCVRVLMAWSWLFFRY